MEFTDFGNDEETATAMREKAFDKFINISQPLSKEQRQIQRGSLVEDVSRQAAQNAKMGTPEKMSGVMADAQMKAAELIPTQGKEQDALNLQGSKMREDIIAGRQQSSLTKYLRKTEEAKQDNATAIAKRGFELGVQGREMALHQNASISDIGMQKLYQDLQAGRENTADIKKLQTRLTLEAQQYKTQFETQMAKLKGELEIDIANKNIEGAKKRAAAMLALAQKAAEAKAKAGNLSAILSGAFGVAGGVVGTIYGGPVGGMAGAKAGSAIGGSISNL
jgi:hypothetical protein